MSDYSWSSIRSLRRATAVKQDHAQLIRRLDNIELSMQMIYQQIKFHMLSGLPTGGAEANDRCLPTGRAEVNVPLAGEVLHAKKVRFTVPLDEKREFFITPASAPEPEVTQQATKDDFLPLGSTTGGTEKSKIQSENLLLSGLPTGDAEVNRRCLPTGGAEVNVPPLAGEVLQTKDLLQSGLPTGGAEVNYRCLPTGCAEANILLAKEVLQSSSLTDDEFVSLATLVGANQIECQKRIEEVQGECQKRLVETVSACDAMISKFMTEKSDLERQLYSLAASLDAIEAKRSKNNNE